MSARRSVYFPKETRGCRSLVGYIPAAIVFKLHTYGQFPLSDGYAMQTHTHALVVYMHIVGALDRGFFQLAKHDIAKKNSRALRQKRKRKTSLSLSS